MQNINKSNKGRRKQYCIIFTSFMLTNGIAFGNREHAAFVTFSDKRKLNQSFFLSSSLSNVGRLDNTNIDYRAEDDDSLRLLQALDPQNKRNDDHQHGNESYHNDPLLSILQLDHNKQSNNSDVSFTDKLSSNDILPFDCTGCGKCCQTKGEVYLNPKETLQAADTLHLTVDEFKQKYVEREITSKSRPSESWTVLKQIKDSNDIEGCIFLDEDTKFCTIYEARPVQCSTYPFWPRVMESLDSWNEEVVFTTPQDLSNDDDRDFGDRIWTSEHGGCEGMKEIKVDNSSGILELVNVSDNHNDIHQNNGVSVDDAKERLELYSRYKRAFPKK